jgi:hypothetical protein
METECKSVKYKSNDRYFQEVVFAPGFFAFPESRKKPLDHPFAGNVIFIPLLFPGKKRLLLYSYFDLILFKHEKR